MLLAVSFLVLLLFAAIAVNFVTPQKLKDQFPSAVKLGSDGIDSIVVVQTSSQEATLVTAEMKPVTAKEWSEFIKPNTIG